MDAINIIETTIQYFEEYNKELDSAWKILFDGVVIAGCEFVNAYEKELEEDEEEEEEEEEGTIAKASDDLAGLEL